MKTCEDRAEELISSITYTREELVEMYQSALDQLHKGLKMHKKDPMRWHPKESDYMMLDCCLAELPTGKENGIFYGLDFGGTNVRVLRAMLNGQGSVEVTQLRREIRDVGVSEELPKGVLDSKASATMLFDTIADLVHEMIIQSGDEDKEIPIGFTFSFGITQPQLDVAFLGQWSKGFETGFLSDDPVVGRDVCELANQALQRKGIPAKITCVLNDTTGTMIAAAIEKERRLPPCLIGLIVGTGINACYFDPEAPNYGYNGVVINVELSGFKRGLKTSVADAQVDFFSSNRGEQLLEKLVSGHYVCEAVRLMCLQSLQHMAPACLWEPYSLSTAQLAEIYSASGDDAIKVTAEQMKSMLGVDCLHKGGLRVCKQIVDAVFDRSARLIAVQVAALAKKTCRLQRAMGGVTVGVDGSLFVKNDKYKQVVNDTLQWVLGAEVTSLVKFQITSDGSGKGAACLAATVGPISKRLRM